MGWTVEQMDIIKAMWLEGRTSAEITKELGTVSRSAVMGKIHRMGLTGSAVHNSKMTKPVYGACRPIMPETVEPEVAPADTVDPNVVRLSRGTIARAYAGAICGVVPSWRYAEKLVGELTGQEFSWSKPATGPR